MLYLEQNFSKYHRSITTFLLERKAHYFHHDCYNILKERVKKLNDYIDLRFKQNESFAAEISFPMYRERYLLRRAMLRRNFKADPIATLDAIGDTPEENAKTAQTVLNLNLQNTFFRKRCLSWMHDTAARSGAWVAVSKFVEGFETGGTRTIYNPDHPSMYQRVQLKPHTKRNVANYHINPLNYFQEPECPNSEQASYKGYIDLWKVSELINIVNTQPENYIKENCDKVIAQIKKSGWKDTNYDNSQQKGEVGDFSKGATNVDIFYAQIHINGNEDDETFYYVEMCNDMIIRFQACPHDRNICELTTGCLLPRQDYWWGNNDGEAIISHQNFVNYLMNMKAEQGLRLMDRFIFVKGNVDWSAVNNRHLTGGIIPFNGVEDMNKSIWQFQPQDNSTQYTDSVLREIKESAQTMRPTPNVSSKYSEGGMVNQTATAANMAQGIGDILEDDLMECYAEGLETMIYKNMVLLQQYLGDLFKVKPQKHQVEAIVKKYQILGDFGYNITSALDKNKLQQFTRINNFMTALMNFRGSGDPSWTAVKLPYYIKKFLENSDIGNVEEGYDDQMALAQQPGNVPSAPSSGMPALSCKSAPSPQMAGAA